MAIDFNAYLAGDPTYQDAVRAIAASRQADLDQLNAQRYQALIHYGEVPTLLTTGDPLGFDVPQSIRDAAALATRSGFSTIGQLAQQYADAQSLARGNLGERGIIRSGDYAYLTNRNLRAQQLGQAAALDTLQTGMGDAQRNYLALLDALRGQQSDAANAAWSRMMDQINAQAAADAAAQAAADRAAMLAALAAQGGGGGGDGGAAAPTAQGPGYSPGFAPGPSGGGAGTSSGGISSGPEVGERPTASTPAAPLPPEPSYVPDASNDYFVQHQSPDIPSYPIYSPPPAPSPVVPPAGYGGTRTAGQVRRNML